MDDLGSSVLIGEWSSANHEKQYSRLFRSWVCH
jgi:urease accessory protein UreF